jgi:hypothetical protein
LNVLGCENPNNAIEIKKRVVIIFVVFMMV